MSAPDKKPVAAFTIHALIEVHRRDGLEAALALADTWATVEVAGAITDYIFEDTDRDNWPPDVRFTREQFEAAVFADACTWDADERRSRITRALGSVALAELSVGGAR